MSVFPYPVCHQTVTVYRKNSDTVMRRVAHGCYYRFEDHLQEDAAGLRFVRKFLLIQPGNEVILPGDRILEGIGPTVDSAQWDKFVPACVPGLSQVAYAAPWHWEGKICHYEAGRK
jgi:hypothetical protein